MSRATTSGPVSDTRVLHRQRRELAADLRHRPVQVDPHDLARSSIEVLVGHVGQEPGRVALELLQEHAVRA